MEKKPKLRVRNSLQHFASQKPARNKPWWTNFAAGGMAAISGWMFVHPFDVLKVRAQLSNNANLGNIARDMFRTEGVLSFYSGLTAALARQVTYGNLRLGFYASFKQAMVKSSKTSSAKTTKKKDEISTMQNLGLGLTAGGLAAFLSNPVEVSLVRMQADGKLPPENRRNYRNVFDALGRIVRQEGILTLWKGATPTVARAMLVNALQVGGYDVAKRSLRSSLNLKRESVGLHLGSALIAGFVYSLGTLPIDIAKTRIQTQLPGSTQYRGIFQTISSIARSEGVLSLWNGFLPYFARCGGHTVMMFLFLEQYRTLLDSYYR